jgi:hypothetical protein
MGGRILDHNGAIMTRVHEDGDGMTIQRTQDVEAILDDNKAQRAEFDGFSHVTRSMRKIASIPLIVYEKWMAEDGVDLMAMPAEESAAYIKKKLRDPNYAHLRTVDQI